MGAAKIRDTMNSKRWYYNKKTEYGTQNKIFD